MALVSLAPAGEASEAGEDVRFLDLTLLVSQEYPVNWPDIFPYFHINHYLKIGPRGPYNSDIITIDENTGTQFDSPAHGPVPREIGKITPERVADLAIPGGGPALSTCATCWTTPPSGTVP